MRRHNFAAFDAKTGKLLPCAPSFTGYNHTVRAMKPSPDGRVLYVGGSFNQAGSEKAANAVAVNTAGCSVRKDFKPAVSATVRAIETTDRAVYLGGDFGSVGGQIRNHMAAVSPKGSLLPFKADFDQSVRALSATPSHGRIFVGGDFESVNGQTARSLVALDPTTGSTVLAYPGLVPGPVVGEDDRRRTSPASSWAPRGTGRASTTAASRDGSPTTPWCGRTPAVAPPSPSFPSRASSTAPRTRTTATRRPAGSPSGETASICWPSRSRTRRILSPTWPVRHGHRGVRPRPGAPAGFDTPVEMTAKVVAPKGATSSRPLALFLHGRHNTCYKPGSTRTT
ncbi:hypothetical protein SALBM311S_09467 [Streptomyces alboniger]